jgi:hypothetical protein
MHLNQGRICLCYSMKADCGLWPRNPLNQRVFNHLILLSCQISVRLCHVRPSVFLLQFWSWDHHQLDAEWINNESSNWSFYLGPLLHPWTLHRQLLSDIGNSDLKCSFDPSVVLCTASCPCFQAACPLKVGILLLVHICWWGVAGVQSQDCSVTIHLWATVTNGYLRLNFSSETNLIPIS